MSAAPGRPKQARAAARQGEGIPVSANPPPAAPAASARSLLLTLLGEYVYPSTEGVWTQTLLQAFALVGIAEKAARQALARANTAGWIEGGKEGRQAWWALSPGGSALIAEGSRRVLGLAQNKHEWAGGWLLLHVTLPETRRADRLRLYRVLHWMGFGSPTPGLWICPHADRADAVRAQLRELGLEDDTLAFQARSLDFGIPQPTLVQKAWDVPALAEHYLELESRFSALRPRNAEDHFQAHAQLVNAFQRLPAVDPGLPHSLLPSDWVGTRVTKRLNELRARWREPAHAQWQAMSEIA
ncbi:PaaX family transcriptional regulator [Hydrogenophaga sp. BPS33]|uniref:PaaX family transcriptional regulator n=1 Tax=Hydrogenophaga sp. BPS33 TaxID=2651974 RepID=UPI00135ABAA3|nr:PaaX family transcriptional regulator C-terminal domain-containing protein [Hydrogenophaga sp. BPS33]